ncbi:MAG: cytochrome b/b6 domain-containing protein [Burkholderiaceae bacterium]|nr:cytochrome b/b6 domain-containing protein [Rhodoferax sp.]MCB2007185.1 cytochrome b/b6 domain-containing protein [Rhodoferax sp.]MCB2031033.1 cytochrome b/b6 domain-containing protein [Rhodoferax sp.]MCP5260546.1 cytochrome b/b6 domain-containing protein [Rhodoferax sp.]
MNATAPRAATRLVWSVPVRLLHWTLALSMIASFVTHEGGGALHEWTGYVALAAALLRVAMGLFGSGLWRFSGFVRGLRATRDYALAIWRRRERHYVGHNPLGAWMVLALLADAVATGFTGWLYTTDRFWGVAWVEELHGALGHALVPLLALHVAGVVFTSLRQRENLVASMLHGRKRVESPADGSRAET